MNTPKLKPCPPGGTGVHAWLYYAACRCIDAEMELDDAEALIAPMMTRSPAPAQEVRHALEAASGEREDTVKWPPRSFKLVQSIFAGPKASFNGGDGEFETEEVIDELFPDNPFLCVGYSSSVFVTARREELRGGLSRRSLIVPSPMTGLRGVTKAGHKSAHSLDNTGPRRYIVAEYDWGTPENQAKLILHLSQYAPLRMVVHSGGKSIHGWFGPCVDENMSRLFFAQAAATGADPRLWLKSQFCRMPGGTRDGHTKQEILHFQ